MQLIYVASTAICKLARIVYCNNAALALIATKGAEISNSCARSPTVAIQENLLCVTSSTRKLAVSDTVGEPFNCARCSLHNLRLIKKVHNFDK